MMIVIIIRIRIMHVEDGKCQFKPSSVVAKISSWAYITTSKNETEMMAGLASKGPLSICVDAGMASPFRSSPL